MSKILVGHRVCRTCPPWLEKGQLNCIKLVGTSPHVPSPLYLPSVLVRVIFSSISPWILWEFEWRLQNWFSNTICKSRKKYGGSGIQAYNSVEYTFLLAAKIMPRAEKLQGEHWQVYKPPHCTEMRFDEFLYTRQFRAKNGRDFRFQKDTSL